MRPTIGRSVSPAQAITNDMDDAAVKAAVINTRNPTWLWPKCLAKQVMLQHISENGISATSNKAMPLIKGLTMQNTLFINKGSSPYHRTFRYNRPIMIHHTSRSFHERYIQSNI